MTKGQQKSVSRHCETRASCIISADQVISPMTLAWTLTLTQTSSVSLSSSTSSHRTPSCWAMYSDVTFRPPGRHTERKAKRSDVFMALSPCVRWWNWIETTENNNKGYNTWWKKILNRHKQQISSSRQSVTWKCDSTLRVKVSNLLYPTSAGLVGRRPQVAATLLTKASTGKVLWNPANQLTNHVRD